VRPAPRVLYVEGATERAHFLADALRAHHIEVASMGPEPFVQDPQALRGFDALILSDLLVQNIDARTAAAIEAFVRDDGGGLVFSSGDSTYGHEGYAGSAMERLLPVRFEGKRKKSEVDLVLLIDRSHSMRGRKLELAKTAALSTLDLLEPRHRLAVVAFDSKPHEVVPLAPVGTRRRAEDLIASMTAKGQTSLYPALAEARRLLANSTAQIKHVILMSDGITAQPPSTASTSDDGQAILAEIIKGRAEALRRDGIAVVVPDAPEPPPAPGAIEAVVAELAAAGVTVSTVVVGDKPNLALMRDIAILGHGRTQVARADAEIPGLFVKEARQLLGESMIEEPFRPTVSHSATVLDGVDFTKGPPLRGIVVARPKRFADVLLQGPKAGPLLATTHYGLGRSVAFLSDVNNRWSADWVGWDGYARLWAQVVRHVARVPSQMLAFEVHRSGTEAVLSLRAETREGFHRNGLAPVARMTSPDGESASVPLRPVSPGTYAARRPVASGSARPYRFELLGSGGLTGEEVRRVGTRTLFHPWPDEDRTQAADIGTLQALAERTGGAVSASTAEIFRRHGDGSAIRRALWPVLVAAALVMFLLDVYWRRAGGRRRETVPGRGEAASR
ncbi:MAG: VWA domain-containing protein, partial [Betaproteobacteria bacterium]|nr:VWA domain-containing protein [Betaproteobacteria bacterium]